MLFASKRELHAGVALSILQVREQELAYYTANINNIGLQASLLAGFAFSTLSSHESINVLDWVVEEPGQPFLLLSLDLTPAQQLMALLELLYLVSTISAMGSTLYTLYICLVTSILGPGLALRGPEGSVDRAVVGLARVNRKVIQSFGFALDLFQFSILVTTFLNFHVLAASVCSACVLYYMARIKRYTAKLTREFSVDKAQIVTGRFAGEGVGQRLHAAEQLLFPTFADTVRDACASAAKKAARAGARLRGRKGAPPAKSSAPPPEFPSYVASDMMHHWQGPLPERFDGDLAAAEVPAREGFFAQWLGSLFGADAARPAELPPALRAPPARAEGPLPLVPAAGDRAPPRAEAAGASAAAAGGAVASAGGLGREPSQRSDASVASDGSLPHAHGGATPTSLHRPRSGLSQFAHSRVEL